MNNKIKIILLLYRDKTTNFNNKYARMFLSLFMMMAETGRRMYNPLFSSQTLEFYSYEKPIFYCANDMNDMNDIHNMNELKRLLENGMVKEWEPNRNINELPILKKKKKDWEIRSGLDERIKQKWEGNFEMLNKIDVYYRQLAYLRFLQNKTIGLAEKIKKWEEDPVMSLEIKQSKWMRAFTEGGLFKHWDAEQFF